MKALRKAREAAMQVLFQRGFQQGTSAKDLFYAFADNFTFEQDTKDYALYLTENVIEREEEINGIIEQHSQNWRLDRIAVIDKILLQIAIFELRLSEQTSTPAKLCIVDIIDLAKKYSSEESKNFINGILDQVYQNEMA